MLHAGMDMHKHFSVVTVVDDSGNEVVKGRKLENTDLEIVMTFRPRFAKGVEAYQEMTGRGKSGLLPQSWL